MTSLRQRHHAVYKRCDSPKERRNADGTFMVDGASWIATRELVAMGEEIGAALWRLEELEKKL
jgi:hypothetical protein